MTRRPPRPKQRAAPSEPMRQTQKFNWHAPIRGLIALVVFVAVLVLFAAPASAGTYSVYSCEGPANEPLGAEGWVQEVTGAPLSKFVFSGDCATTGLKVAFSPSHIYSNAELAALNFRAPANTEIGGTSLTRQLSVDFLAGGSGTYSAVVRERRGLNSTTAGCVGRTSDCLFGFPTPETVDENLSPSELVGLEISCNVSICDASAVDVHANLNSARIDLVDTDQPHIESISGTLLSGPAAPGARSLFVSASDLGGGLRRVTTSIDGGTLETHEIGGACAEPFSRPVPCPLNLTSSFSVDTSQLSPGVHSLTVAVEDAAGETDQSDAIPFTVLSSSVPPPVGSDGQPLTNGQPAVERPLLNIAEPRIESKRGGITVVAGTLRTADGRPIAGATVVPVEIDLGNPEAPETALPTAVTNADGTFSVAVVASGAKKIRLSFRPNPGSAETAIATMIVRQDLVLSVKRSKAKVKRGGRITISGVLTGAGSATNDAPVEINALVNGKWRAVGVVETDAKGRYSWKYRFVSVRRATTFKFRALVRRSAAWPWPTEVGSTVSVRVAR